MKKIVVAVVALLIVGGIAGYGWYAWDTGKIPGNPRAPTKENFEAAVRKMLAELKVEPEQKCVSLGLRPASAVREGVRGLKNDPLPGVYSVTLLEDLAGSVRGVDLAKMSALAKAGFFTQSATSITDRAGETRPAREFRLTWDGYFYVPESFCFPYGKSEFAGVRDFVEHPSAGTGITVYEVAFDFAVVNPAPWTKNPEVQNVFPEIKASLAPKTRRIKFLRGDRGWVSEIEMQLQQSTQKDYAEFQKRLQIPPELDLKKVQAAVDAFAAATPRSAMVCLNLPTSGMADEIGDFANRDPALTYFATYYDRPGRSDTDAKRVAQGLLIMRMIERAGLADTAPVPVNEALGVGASGGQRFVLKQRYKSMIDNTVYSGNSCLPVGTVKFEAKAFNRVGTRNTQSIFEGQGLMNMVAAMPQFRAQFSDMLEGKRASFKARATFVDLSDWVKESTSIEMLPMVSIAVKEGLGANGMIEFKDGQWLASYASARLQPLQEPANPAEIFADLPRIQYPPGTKLPTTLAPLAGQGTSGSAIFSAIGMEVHAISVYEGVYPAPRQPGSRDRPVAPIEVAVDIKSKPIALYLSAYEPIEWKIRVSPGAILKKVIATGYYPPQVNGVPRDTIVLRGSYEGGGSRAPALPYQQGLDAAAAKIIQTTTGAPMVSYQGSYKGQAFSLSNRSVRQGVAPAFPIQLGGSAPSAQAGIPPRPPATRETAVIQCGRSTIVCDANDTVICGGRQVKCPVGK